MHSFLQKRFGSNDLISQWASRGNDVHLIDGQTSQLQASIENVRQLRSQLSPNGNFGKVHGHLPEFMKAALNESWLVVEVYCAKAQKAEPNTKNSVVHS